MVFRRPLHLQHHAGQYTDLLAFMSVWQISTNILHAAATKLTVLEQSYWAAKTNLGGAISAV